MKLSNKTVMVGFLLLAAFVVPLFLVGFHTKNFGVGAREVLALSPEEERAQLEAELKKLEEQIAKYNQDISKTEQEKKTLKNQIYNLRRKIEKLDLQISQGNLMIKDLGYQISDTEKSIALTEDQIRANVARLIKILRILYQERQKSPLEMLLANARLSYFFENVMALERLHLEQKNLLASIKNLKSYLNEQKQALEENKDEMQRVVRLQMLQKQEEARAKQEQERLLGLTEAQYQQQLREKEATEKRAAEIRARIFELIGVVAAPTFGEAVAIAKSVEALIGIRPAFLLAILTQESNIGKNVGQCNLIDTTSGRSVSIRTGQTFQNGIHPTRDLPLFLTITKAVGRDPLKTPISCPIQGIPGWGGAMGPAQFIPSTWMLYKDRIAQLKNGEPDPWNIKDAFLASGVYLVDAGGTKRSYDSEWCAAVAYFSGSCSSRNQKLYGSYANSVMAIAKQYEQDIATISQ